MNDGWWQQQEQEEQQQQIEYQQMLHELLDYNCDTGVFTWKKPRRGVKTGVPLGCDNGSGYLRITVAGKSEYAHRLAWVYVHGFWPTEHIDHINGNRSDNRIANLRAATSAENMQNMRQATKRSNSNVLGVSWHKRASKWQVHICVGKKRKYLGLFEDKSLAEQTYLAAKREMHPFNTL